MKKLLPGILFTFIIAVISFVLGDFFPLIGSAVFAILLGILYRNLFRIPYYFEPGAKFSGKKLLQYSIIAMGFTLSFAQITATGLASLSITLITIALAILTAALVGGGLGLSSNLRTLVGFGTAICGGSAIAAAAPIIDANEEEIALSISTIFLFNVIAVFLFPFLGHWMGMNDAMFGLWAGTAINDTSSVVAAGYSYSQEAGDIATIVKLTRALMIVPCCLIMAGLRVLKNRQQKTAVSLKSIIPWFILWFLAASVVSSLGLFPAALIPYAKTLSKLLMAMALAGIGAQVSFAQFKSAGLKPVLTGASTWFVVAASSLLLQHFMLA